MGIAIIIDGSLCRIDHSTGFTQPLQSAFDPLAFGVGNGRQLERGMRGVIGEKHKEWSRGILLGFRDNQLLGLGGP